MDLPIGVPLLGLDKDYIVAFGHLKVIRDKTTNGNKETKETKRTVSSKLPQTAIRSDSSSRSRRTKSNRQANIISGSAAGTSHQIYLPAKSKTIKLESEEKYKPSLIPRRKSAKEFNTKEPVSLRTINKNKTSRQQSVIEPKIIQRVQHLNINPVTTARPIPTLGQIYSQDLNNVITSDWYLESAENLNTVQNSIESSVNLNKNVRSACIAISNESSLSNEPINKPEKDIKNTTNLKTIHLTSPLKIFKSTNENVSDWITTELDHSTKDDESGYRSMSPPQRAICCDAKVKKSTVLRIPHDEKHYVYSTLKKSASTTSIKKKSDSGTKDKFVFGNQATVVINKGNRYSSINHQYFNVPKINTDVRALINSKSDIHKPVKYHSTPNPSRKREDIKVAVASYVEYPSEVLQKTTNFESEAYVTSNRPDLNLCDINPSQWTLDHVDEYSVPTDATVWSRLQSSQESSLLESSKTSYLTEESWKDNKIKYKNETPRTKCPGQSDKYSYHDYYNHYCWRKEVAKKDIEDQSLWDYRGRCKMCQKYRITHNKSIHRPFQALKSRIRIGGNHKYGWSRVWKKTTERWSHWSKSTSRFGKLRMNNLRKSLIWDNANVQTTILVYRETGTDAVAKEQKSAEITASLKFSSWAALSKNDSSTTSTKCKKSQIKHVNIGPSMFPFLYYPSTVLVARSLSKRQSQSNLSTRNSNKNKLKEVEEMKSPRISARNQIGNKSIEDTLLSISKSTSIIALPNYVIENGTVTENVTTPMENKVTSTLINFNRIKLADTVSQDAYTQMFITCNNAETDIKYDLPVISASNIVSKASAEDFYYGIDRGTEPIPPIHTTQRSISIMTSKGIIQELTDKDTQVIPESSVRKISTPVLAQQRSKDAKSNATVPCRKFDNVLVTSKGTILSCTGTKVMSVSSAHIRTASEISRTSRFNTVNTDCLTTPSVYRSKLENVLLDTEGLQSIKTEKSTSCAIRTFADAGISAASSVDRVSRYGGSSRTFNPFFTATNVWTTANTNCWTSPSLYRSQLVDICLGTDEFQSVKSEKSTSCALKTFADAGITASNLVDRSSFNGGSHRTLISFSTALRPECTSAYVNTDLELESNSTKIGLSFDNHSEKTINSKRDCHAQYSERFDRSNNDTSNWEQSNSRYLTNIGHSRLLSVRMLSDSVTEMATQVEPVFQCAETNTMFKPKTSTSVLTSRYSIDVPLRSKSKAQPKYKECSLACRCARSGCYRKTIDVEERTSQAAAPAYSDFACKINGSKSVLSLTTQTRPDSSPADSNTEPNAVISSKLNATKWMKGCVKESVKDVQSIISIIEAMVTESLDRAALVIASSKARESISEMEKLSKVLINHQPAISCVTATGYDPSTSVSVTKLLPIINKTNTQDPIDEQNQNDVVIINQMTSDDDTTNEIKEPVHEVDADLRDTVSSGNAYYPISSTSITKLLPTKNEGIAQEERIPIDKQNQNDVVMVHQMTSDETTTNYIKEAIPQLHQNLRDTGTDCDVIMAQQQSASVLTSRHILAGAPRCSNTCDVSSRDCIFVYDRPRCVVHSFLADAIAQTDVHNRNSEMTCEKPGSVSNRSVGLLTSFDRHVQCSRQKSCVVGEVLSPKVYKALYETTKLIAKEGSQSVTPKGSDVGAPPKKTENEDAIRSRCTQRNDVSQMTSRLLSEPTHCFCARCLNTGNMTSTSIQTAKKSRLQCPNCNAMISKSYYSNPESIQESYLVASCRYYSNLLTIKLGQVKENFIKHIAPPIEEASYHEATITNNISQCTLSNNNIIFNEACTMKPSGKQDENCQAKLLKQKFNQHSCILFPALSLTDVRGTDRNDLKNVYYILTAIEGRVRRLKNNLTC